MTQRKPAKADPETEALLAGLEQAALLVEQEASRHWRNFQDEKAEAGRDYARLIREQAERLRERQDRGGAL